MAQYLGAKDDGPERVPGKATINFYLGKAGGDPNKAKELAAAAGNDDWKLWQENGGNAVPSDDRNGLQKTFDELTNVTPEQEQKTKAIPLLGPALNPRLELRQRQTSALGSMRGREAGWLWSSVLARA